MVQKHNWPSTIGLHRRNKDLTTEEILQRTKMNGAGNLITSDISSSCCLLLLLLSTFHFDLTSSGRTKTMQENTNKTNTATSIGPLFKMLHRSLPSKNLFQVAPPTSSSTTHSRMTKHNSPKPPHITDDKENVSWNPSLKSSKTQINVTKDIAKTTDNILVSTKENLKSVINFATQTEEPDIESTTLKASSNFYNRIKNNYSNEDQVFKTLEVAHKISNSTQQQYHMKEVPPKANKSMSHSVAQEERTYYKAIKLGIKTRMTTANVTNHTNPCKAKDHIYHQEMEYTNICTTEDCVLTAAKILSSMDKSVKPCDDFYKFACGGWMKQSTQTPNNQYHTIDKQNQNIVQKLLETANVKNVTGNDNAKQETISAQKNAKMFYRSCLHDVVESDMQDNKYLLDVITGAGGSSFLGTTLQDSVDHSQSSDSNSFEKRVQKLHNVLGVHVFFTWGALHHGGEQRLVIVSGGYNDILDDAPMMDKQRYLRVITRIIHILSEAEDDTIIVEEKLDPFIDEDTNANDISDNNSTRTTFINVTYEYEDITDYNEQDNTSSILHNQNGDQILNKDAITQSIRSKILEVLNSPMGWFNIGGRPSEANESKEEPCKQGQLYDKSNASLEHSSSQYVDKMHYSDAAFGGDISPSRPAASQYISRAATDIDRQERSR